MSEFSFKNKNVVILIKDAILGGAERQALGFAAYLKTNLNCRVSIVVTYSNEQSADFKSFLNEIGIEKVHYFGAPSLSVKKEISLENLKKTLRAFRYLSKITLGIRKLNPDILVPFMNGPSKIASLIYKFTGAETTFWHQLGLEVYFYDWLEEIAIRRSPKIIANAENGLDIFRNHYQVPDKKLFVLPQYVAIKKLDFDKEMLRRKFGIPLDALVVGMIAHYRDEKLQELLLDAFAEIPYRNLHLVLLGSHRDNENTNAKFERLKQKINESGLQNRIALLSDIAVEKVLSILDIGVLVSKIEGTPNVVMEYMLYGLPIIATDHKGCRMLLGDSEFLIPNDKSILKQKITELAENPGLRIKIGDENRIKIERNSPQHYFEKLEILLNK